MTDWEKYLESLPLDNDPLCPGNANYSLAHYNQLGTEIRQDLQSVTHRMLNEIYEKQQVDDTTHKYLLNFYTYKELTNIIFIK